MDGIHWLEFELFAEQKDLVHGIFLRQDDIYSGPADLNRRRMLNALNIPRAVSCVQVQGDRVVHVSEDFKNTEECDGLITKESELALMIRHADCQAAIFYDPIHKALANVHSGWRGNVKNIYRTTVEKMAFEFGTSPQDLLVGVSPSLGPKNSEFKNFRQELPEAFWEFQIKPEYFDLWAIARWQLEQCGILSSHIQIAQVCTYENEQDFYSYRRDKTRYKNHATLAMLL